jgi:hypothetical protein
MFTRRICSICLMLLVAATGVQAVTLTIGSDADTWTAATETDPYGALDYMVLYGAGSGYSGYLRFDLAAVNVTKVEAATLTLTVHGAIPKPPYRNDTVVIGRFALYGLNDVAGNTIQNWDEATFNGSDVGAEMDWTTGMVVTAGGRATDLDDDVQGITETVTNAATGGWDLGTTITITGDALVRFIQSRVDDDGLVTFILKDDDAAARGYGICTKEYADETYRPRLEITGAVSPKTAATEPSPADKATDVARDVVLSWTPGVFAGTHDVYFGTSFDDVNTAQPSTLVSQGQDANTYDPTGSLTLGQTYYWRVDEVNATSDAMVYRGLVWSFTVEPVSYPVTNVTASASSFDAGKGPENTVNGSGLDETGLLHGQDGATMWLSAASGVQPTWIQYDFDRVYKLQQMWLWNYNVEFESLLGFGIKNATIQYSVDGSDWTALGDFDLAQGPGAAEYAHSDTIDFGGAAAKQVRITVNSGFSSLGQFGLSEVRFFYIPVFAREPEPADGAAGVSLTPTLSWRAGREAASHDVYLGTDPNVLTLNTSVTTASCGLANLNVATTYYWRVGEVNLTESVTTWPGNLWSFTTQDAIMVDDMESYDDSDNRVYDTWIDGFGTTTNGSQVGYSESADGTFNETSTVHGGSQSMPFYYGKDGLTNSEAIRTFDSAQNWTANGVTALNVYFYGQTDNTTTVPFWIKLTDQSGKNARVAYGDVAGEDVANLAATSWTKWSIPLSSFTGVTLSKIKSMTIGFGTASGSGLVFIDDIELGVSE